MAARHQAGVPKLQPEATRQRRARHDRATYPLDEPPPGSEPAGPPAGSPGAPRRACQIHGGDVGATCDTAHEEGMTASEQPDRTIRPGMRFQHARQLRTDWTPGPGQRYADAPKQTMEITAVRTGRVYYRAPGAARGQFVADLRHMSEGGPVVGRWIEAAPSAQEG